MDQRPVSAALRVALTPVVPAPDREPQGIRGLLAGVGASRLRLRDLDPWLQGLADTALGLLGLLGLLGVANRRRQRRAHCRPHWPRGKGTARRPQRAGGMLQVAKRG